MAFHNRNYSAKLLSSSQTYTQGDLGDGLTASTVHEIYCLSAGTITITPYAGDTFGMSMTVGQKVEVLVRQVVVGTGTFVAFSSKFTPPQGGPYFLTS